MDAPELPEELKFDRDRFLAATRDEDHDAAIAAEVAKRVGDPSTQSVAIAHYRNAAGVERELTGGISQIFEQVAEAMFWQGKFAAASFMTDDEAKREDFKAHDAAMQKLDAPVCTCPDIRMPSPTNAKGVSSPARREIQRVFVGSIGKEVAFIRCETCKGLFAQTA
jgi:hypothetical protein